MFYPAPQQFDIVYGYFPYQTAPSEPAIDPHYCLVLHVFEDEDTADPWVIVAFGTSQRVDPLYSGEFCVLQSHQSFPQTGLSKSTKFSLTWDRIAKLPYNDTWFSIPPERRASGQLHPRIGKLDRAFYGVRLRAAGEAVDARATIEALENHPLGALTGPV